VNASHSHFPLPRLPPSHLLAFLHYHTVPWLTRPRLLLHLVFQVDSTKGFYANESLVSIPLDTFCRISQNTRKESGSQHNGLALQKVHRGACLRCNPPFHAIRRGHASRIPLFFRTKDALLARRSWSRKGRIFVECFR